MDVQSALFAASFVQCAYDPSRALPDGFRLRLVLMGNDLAGTSAEDRVAYGLLAESEDAIVIAIRGTETPLEWIQDARFGRIPFRTWGQTTTGFTQIYKSLSDPTPLLTAGKRLIITGHSLGAALATLLAIDLHSFNPEVYAFAPPNAGDQAFADVYNSLVPSGYRIVELTDIVPHLPPTLMGYRNAGKSVVLSHIGGIEDSHALSTYVASLESLNA